MDMTVQALQRRLIALGYPLPHFGADGDFGSESVTAVNKALDELATLRGVKPPEAVANVPATTASDGLTIPADWMPDAKISRIIFHWTAGQNKANDLDREHYHILIEGDGKLVRGKPSIALNTEPKAKAGYAAHTLNCNTGSIGVSLCGMAGAIENPFSAGKQSITRAQWNALVYVLVQLCKRYGIQVDRKTVLSHAEVQITLKITQRGKWDIARLPFDTSIQGAIPIGDQMRALVQSKL
ncbi:N-acetylmuramoyl-L-alanine amidase family 2 [Rhizobium sp. CF080]|uniref:peptidoglycan recognition protein family protein n=1 Tax=Rhizobium sp. (strain CF080) TaxID=1144310 RepID=UPI0002717813|nr:N-acetylmuramoyl-L-alanine amidase [Rhizobium sp. CF080]EUB95869.1 N-acetylmuramoyl-L-alanine amidase family 2 [Rhizobium sp. CF080]